MEILLIVLFVLILAIRAYLKSPKVRGAIGESKVSRRLDLFLPSKYYEIFKFLEESQIIFKKVMETLIK